jgi:hypothetical protein
MKRSILTLIAALALATSGCTNLSHTITSKDGTQTSLKITGFMSNKAVATLSNGGGTEKSQGRLKIGSINDDVTSPMAQFTELLKVMGEITAKGATKAIVPAP